MDIANIVTFLLSDAARLITGETIIADGGHCLGAPNSLAMVRQLALADGVKSKL